MSVSLVRLPNQFDRKPLRATAATPTCGGCCCCCCCCVISTVSSAIFTGRAVTTAGHARRPGLNMAGAVAIAVTAPVFAAIVVSLLRVVLSSLVPRQTITDSLGYSYQVPDAGAQSAVYWLLLAVGMALWVTGIAYGYRRAGLTSGGSVGRAVAIVVVTGIAAAVEFGACLLILLTVPALLVLYVVGMVAIPLTFALARRPKAGGPPGYGAAYGAVPPPGYGYPPPGYGYPPSGYGYSPEAPYPGPPSSGPPVSPADAPLEPPHDS